MLAAMSYTGTAYHVPGAKHITMDHVFNGTFNAQKQSLNWVPEGLSNQRYLSPTQLLMSNSAGDGVFSIAQDGYIKLVDLKTNTTKDLVALKDIKDVCVSIMIPQCLFNLPDRSMARSCNGQVGNSLRT